MIIICYEQKVHLSICSSICCFVVTTGVSSSLASLLVVVLLPSLGIGCCRMRGLQEDLVQLHIVGETEGRTRTIAGVEDMPGEARAIDWGSDSISISIHVYSALFLVRTDFTVKVPSYTCI